ncbi:DUF2778 domain-containing protein [Archangium sp. Cb G35]|uniref:tlde1 domain-containing protein n=1 Tax=Archangium sp. Cb G35 TaxID=1920190 RepID=UPI0009F86B01|nr:DUF2778 domain-containing protein [Archangium sp. Cb G35]
MSWTGQQMHLIRSTPMGMQKARQLLTASAPTVQVSSLTDEQVIQQLARIMAPRASVEPATLHFNGHMLRWRQAFPDKISATSWPAVSGRSGYQTKEHQEKADKGPIPEGEWLVSQGEYQQMPERSLLDKLINELGRGGWPGGESSWGKHRIWLKPKSGTKTYGRSGFSIHGGDNPGSAGCIDLVGQMPNFVKMFRAYGKDMDLTVKYE